MKNQFLKDTGFVRGLLLVICCVLFGTVVYLAFDWIYSRTSSKPQIVGYFVKNSGRYNLEYPDRKRIEQVKFPMYAGVSDRGIMIYLAQVDSEKKLRKIRSLTEYQPLPHAYFTNMQFKGLIIPFLLNEGPPRECWDPKLRKKIPDTRFFLVPLARASIKNL